MSKRVGPSRKKLDIRAIADAAGVSISTVSRVMNNSKPVSEVLRTRVLELVRKEHYASNHTARSMVKRRTDTIGVVIPEMSAPFHSLALSGIVRALGSKGRQTLVCTVTDDPAYEIRYLDLFSNGVADGIILMHETQNPRIRSALSNVRIPVVLGSVKLPNVDLPGVGIDDRAAAKEATSYLIGLGHHGIGFIGGSDLTAGRHRTDGYRAALRENGLHFDERLVVHGTYTALSGYEAARELLSREPALTAIFAVSDEMAIGAIRYLKDAGISVPGQCSVIGFDDIELASFSDPPLTTVHQPIRQIGESAAMLVLRLIDDGGTEPKRMTLPYTIVERSSCVRR